MRCRICRYEIGEGSRFCTHCGAPVGGSLPPADRQAEEMNLPVLYVMAGILVLALLFPPWETPPGTPPEFLGFHFILDAPGSPPDGSGMGIISRILLTVEVVTVAVGGLYFAWFFRKR
jgi:hypothetical protein